jgi:fructuronate reductase
LAQRIDHDDPAMVIAEDHMRWVIEDDFAADSPPLESVGVEFVADVEPYEAMKLLLVNAPHSALAYLGHIAGFEYIHDAATQPLLHKVVDQLLRTELMPVARHVAGLVADDYGSRTLDRFANPNIAYETLQVATDGSLKIRERLLPAVSWHLAEGRVPDGLALVLAAWIRFLGGRTDTGTVYSVPDPMADAFAAQLENVAEGRDIVASILGMKSVFPASIGNHAELAKRITIHFDGLSRMGTLAWLQCLPETATGEAI